MGPSRTLTRREPRIELGSCHHSTDFKDCDYFVAFSFHNLVVIQMLARYPEDADQGSSEEEDLDRRNVVREARYVEIVTTFTS